MSKELREVYRVEELLKQISKLNDNNSNLKSKLKEAEEQNKELMDDILEIQDEITCKETTANDIWHLLDNLRKQQDNE